jgi:integral membrane protein (TIGR00529 family)
MQAVLLFRMAEVIKISLVLLLILFLLRKKMGVGYVMLIASAALFVLYGMDAENIATTIKKTVVNGITLKLLLALSLIRILELILRERNILTAMMSTAKVLFKKRRAIIISMPLLIGMLPSLGGAYFSAPMVKEATSGIHMSQEEKAFINYWFRHPWEYVLPLYPGILLASAISNIPLYNLIKANMVYAIMLLATGFLFAMKGVDKDPHKTQAKHAEDKKAQKSASKKNLASFLPIVIVLALVVFLHIELHYALLAVIVPLFFLFRYRSADIIRITRYGFALEVIILILGIMLFKESMDSSGAVRNLSSFFIQQKIPFLPIICILPFVIGLMTGLTVGFVGSTFPLLISMTGDASLAHISLAFSAGFIGVLLSPVHLCLVLTKEYFKADLWGIYKKILPASTIIFIAALLEYMLIS